MKMLGKIVALALTLACGPALAQVTPGTSPLTGPKGGTNNAFMQFTGPTSSLKTYTLANASGTIALLNQAQTWTGAQSHTDGTLILLGLTSGSTTLKAPATSGGTATIFTGTDTFVGRATTDILTNKTFVCANQTSCVVRLGSDVTGNLPLANIASIAANTILGSTAGSTPAALNGAQAGSILCLPNRQVFTTGTNATYTTPTCNSALPTRIEWEMVGGGGGGAGSGTTPGAATAGGNTCVNTSSPACTTPLFSANGGALGSVTAANVAAGGTTASCDLGLVGGVGGVTVGNTGQPGGWGGNSFFGGAGQGAGVGSGPTAVAGSAASANTGSGGGGASSGSTANNGGGGAPGGYCRKLVTSPASSYFYTIGAAGTAGTLGTSGAAGGAGGTGLIIATAYWQ